MLQPGQAWNESSEFADSLTSRPTRRLTSSGLFNNTPTYHLNACFTRDSSRLIIGSYREDGSALLLADPASGDLRVIATAENRGRAWFGGAVSMIQATRQVVVAYNRSLRIYDLDTLAEKVLIEDIGAEYRFGHPAGSIDGKTVFIQREPAFPESLAGDPDASRRYFSDCVARFGGMPTTHFAVDVATRRMTALLDEPIAGCNHVVPNPVDPDLILIDRDWPPRFSHGGDDGQTSRVWVLNIRTGALAEVRPHDANRFQIHSNWSVEGDRVYYHGRSGEAGHYVGAADTAGNVVWEHAFPLFYYGHMCTHTAARAIITDGLFTPDLITAIYYEETDRNGVPRLEVLARHATDWKTVQGQFSHPHCHMSLDGHWLTYNRGEAGRSDVYVVRLD